MIKLCIQSVTNLYNHHHYQTLFSILMSESRTQEEPYDISQLLSLSDRLAVSGSRFNGGSGGGGGGGGGSGSGNNNNNRITRANRISMASTISTQSTKLQRRSAEYKGSSHPNSPTSPSGGSSAARSPVSSPAGRRTFNRPPSMGSKNGYNSTAASASNNINNNVKMAKSSNRSLDHIRRSPPTTPLDPPPSLQDSGQEVDTVVFYENIDQLALHSSIPQWLAYSWAIALSGQKSMRDDKSTAAILKVSLSKL